MPHMDDGPTDGPPGTVLRTVQVTLTEREAIELLQSLQMWADEIQQGQRDPGWHTHVSDLEGNELTISIAAAPQPGPD